MLYLREALLFYLNDIELNTLVMKYADFRETAFQDGYGLHCRNVQFHREIVYLDSFRLCNVSLVLDSNWQRCQFLPGGGNNKL